MKLKMIPGERYEKPYQCFGNINPERLISII
jgi:hypothetical protein